MRRPAPVTGGGSGRARQRLPLLIRTFDAALRWPPLPPSRPNDLDLDVRWQLPDPLPKQRLSRPPSLLVLVVTPLAEVVHQGQRLEEFPDPLRGALAVDLVRHRRPVPLLAAVGALDDPAAGRRAGRQQLFPS